MHCEHPHRRMNMSRNLGEHVGSQASEAPVCVSRPRPGRSRSPGRETAGGGFCYLGLCDRQPTGSRSRPCKDGVSLLPSTKTARHRGQTGGPQARKGQSRRQTKGSSTWVGQAYEGTHGLTAPAPAPYPERSRQSIHATSNLPTNNSLEGRMGRSSLEAEHLRTRHVRYLRRLDLARAW